MGADKLLPQGFDSGKIPKVPAHHDGVAFASGLSVEFCVLLLIQNKKLSTFSACGKLFF